MVFRGLISLILCFVWSLAVHAIEIPRFAFENHLRAKIQAVSEFNSLAEEANRLGIKVYLFGGAAATFGHYVRQDWLRLNSHEPLHQSYFDYALKSIFRSSQDVDLIVDSAPDKAKEFEQFLRRRYPFRSSDGKSIWEVRLLRGVYNDKPGIVEDVDFLRQHSDSMSVGLIALNGEMSGQISDLRPVEGKYYFANDLLSGQIHFFYSKDHNQTDRFLKGLNPPIFSVIRFLTKMFQFSLSSDLSSQGHISRLIKDFSEMDIRTGYAQAWIVKNGRKILENARDLESAWLVIDSIHLRSKLGSLPVSEFGGHLALLMNRVPLTTLERTIDGAGGAEEATAAELGIDIVAHETSDPRAYEAIISSPTLVPNVFISRPNAPGEFAIYGPGFYTKRGLVGGRGTGLTVRLKVDPSARLGIDFEVHPGDIVLFKNRSVLKVIVEDGSRSLRDLFRLLSSRDWNWQDSGLYEHILGRSLSSASNLSQDDITYLKRKFYVAWREVVDGNIDSRKDLQLATQSLQPLPPCRESFIFMPIVLMLRVLSFVDPQFVSSFIYQNISISSLVELGCKWGLSPYLDRLVWESIAPYWTAPGQFNSHDANRMLRHIDSQIPSNSQKYGSSIKVFLSVYSLVLIPLFSRSSREDFRLAVQVYMSDENSELRKMVRTMAPDELRVFVNLKGFEILKSDVISAVVHPRYEKDFLAMLKAFTDMKRVDRVYFELYDHLFSVFLERIPVFFNDALDLNELLSATESFLDSFSDPRMVSISSQYLAKFVSKVPVQFMPHVDKLIYSTVLNFSALPSPPHQLIHILLQSLLNRVDINHLYLELGQFFERDGFKQYGDELAQFALSHISRAINLKLPLPPVNLFQASVIVFSNQSISWNQKLTFINLLTPHLGITDIHQLINLMRERGGPEVDEACRSLISILK